MFIDRYITSIDNLRFFYYFEPNFFIFTGKLGSFKFKTYINYFFKLNKNVLYIIQSILLRFNCNKLIFYDNIKNSIYSIFRHIFANILLSINFGWKIKLKLVGIGYRFHFYDSMLLLKIGYNRYFIYLLPYELNIFVSGRKKRSLELFSINKLVISVIYKFIKLLRIPNVYTGKGIRIRGLNFKCKKGKRTQF